MDLCCKHPQDVGLFIIIVKKIYDKRKGIAREQISELLLAMLCKVHEKEEAELVEFSGQEGLCRISCCLAV